MDVLGLSQMRTEDHYLDLGREAHIEHEVAVVRHRRGLAGFGFVVRAVPACRRVAVRAASLRVSGGGPEAERDARPLQAWELCDLPHGVLQASGVSSSSVAVLGVTSMLTW